MVKVVAVERAVPTYVKLNGQWARDRQSNLLSMGLSYDDVVVLPEYSGIKTLDEVDLRTELVEGIPLAIPIVSANMDSVTEAPMAIFMARVGGIGIIHRAMTIEEQVAQVSRIKDATKYIVDDPPKIGVNDCVAKARAMMDERQRGFVLVMDEEDRLVGLVTMRDVLPMVNGERLVNDGVMTPRERLVVAEPGISTQEAMERLWQARVEKLPLVDGEWHVGGVITDRDLRDLARFPQATKDKQGRLRVGAAVGVQEEAIERAQAVIAAGVDVIVVDVLHGDARRVVEVTAQITKLSPTVPVIAGNVVRGAATRRLVDAGALGVKVGYGDGALCTTRKKTGTGRGQFSAVVECAAEAYKDVRVRIIADGSVREGGDGVKGLAAGGDTLMVGTALAGTDQSPGEVIRDDRTGDRFKVIRGMASREAQIALARARGAGPKNRVPQGISTRVVYLGDAQEVMDELVGGIRSGIANTGAKNIRELQETVVFERQSIAGMQEGNPHVLSSGRVR